MVLCNEHIPHLFVKQLPHSMCKSPTLSQLRTWGRWKTSPSAASHNHGTPG